MSDASNAGASPDRDDLAALWPVADALAALGVPFHVGGSLASSLHGVARTTLDVDVVTALRAEHVEPFVQALSADYYVDAGAVRSAVRNHGSFNAIHLGTMFKIDVFIPAESDFARTCAQRAQTMALSDDDPRQAPVLSAEDVILHKLRWFRSGGGTSDRQWQDVLGVLRVQRGLLDIVYMRRWADALNLRDLLERALAEA